MLEDYRGPLREMSQQFTEITEYLHPEKLASEIKNLEEQTGNKDFWDNREKANEILKTISQKKNRLKKWETIKQKLDDCQIMFELAIEESADEMEQELNEGLTNLKKEIEEYQLQELLYEKEDIKNCYVTIHSGAGGTEACDWANMLLRMYLRWSELKGFKSEIIDLLPGEEAGVKSVTALIKGEYAFGYLKTEIGVHRLVRISPFDSNARRHTSFASIDCIPEIDEDISVDIRPDDLRIDTYRSQGAGGQHVNTTDSAVRITHIPTGIVVQCQNERSQHKNKAKAMSVLKARLYQHYKQEREEEQQKRQEKKKSIEWGSQVRSYVFQPYTLVKDHRTNFEKGDINGVMDGKIDEFINSTLKWIVKNSDVN